MSTPKPTDEGRVALSCLVRRFERTNGRIIRGSVCILAAWPMLVFTIHTTKGEFQLEWQKPDRWPTPGEAALAVIHAYSPNKERGGA